MKITFHYRRYYQRDVGPTDGNPPFHGHRSMEVAVAGVADAVEHLTRERFDPPEAEASVYPIARFNMSHLWLGGCDVVDSSTGEHEERSAHFDGFTNVTGPGPARPTADGGDRRHEVTATAVAKVSRLPSSQR